MTGMNKSEREDLQRLIRQREKTMKSAAKLRSTELLADFENQLASEFRFDDDTVWAEAAKAAQTEIDRSQKRNAARCQELGIPDRFAPSLQLLWCNRGYDNLLEKRRKELRHVAQARVAAIEQDAVVKIEIASIEVLTEIVTAGLESDAARAFVAKLPTVESLMPALSYQEIAGEADPPVIEQLVSPNALRQRRFREKQKALRNAQTVTPGALRNSPDNAAEAGS